MTGETMMGEVEDLRERVAKLEAGQSWMSRRVDELHEKMDRIMELMRQHNGKEGQLSWRAIAQLSAAVSGLVAIITFLIQKVG